MMNIEQYLAAVPEDRKQRLHAIVDKIASLYPDAEASMKYKMPTYTRGDGWVAVANQKNYISLYTCGAHHLAEFKILNSANLKATPIFLGRDAL